MDLFGEEPAPAEAEEDVAEVIEADGLAPPCASELCLGHADNEQRLLKIFDEGKLPHALIFFRPEGDREINFCLSFCAVFAQTWECGSQSK